MIRLAIETATDACSVALFQDGLLVGHCHDVVGRGHAERLIPMIADLPDRGRADQILVDCGPGSFTGVRVGLAAARALGFAWGARVVGYSSLSLIAAAAFARPNAPEALAVAIIGGHGEVFVQPFADTPMRPTAPLASLTPADAALRFADIPLVGSGTHLVTGLPEPVLYPDARHTILLPPELADLPPRPIYGRAPDAKLPG